MMTELKVGKYYNLTHKITHSNPFRGPALIVQRGHINGKIIFRTSLYPEEWYYCDDYSFEYIGDLT